MKPHTSMNYKISRDTNLTDKAENISPFVRRILESIYPDVAVGKKSMIKKLETYCESYPEVPAFKNLLSSVYIQRGDLQRATEVNDWLVKEHPDYLFGKINLALQYLDQEQPEKVPEILGNGMDIGLLYPQRKEFHVEEALAFNEIAVRYFVEVMKTRQAQSRLNLMKEIEEDHPRTLRAAEVLREFMMARGEIRREEDRLRKKEVKLKDVPSHLQTSEPPSFHFPEQMNWLYEDGLELDTNKISQIKSLDPDKLREDLENILYDCVHRYEYFIEQIGTDTNHPTLELPTHALLFLSDLQSGKSIEAILYLMSQSNEFQDFWFRGFLYDQLNMALIYCGQNNPDRIFEFLHAPNIPGENKSLVGENLVAIIQMAPEDRAHYVAQYRSLLERFIKNPDDEDFVDTHTISALIWDVCTLGYMELLPQIKQLYDMNLVEQDMTGSYEEVEWDIEEESDPSDRYDDLDIFEKYEYVQSDGYDDPFASLDIFKEEYLKNFPAPDLNPYSQKPLKAAPKIGRNDPCPCGSGRKYKKCCL